MEHEADLTLRYKVNLVGNPVHESVPISSDEDNNEIIRKWTPLPESQIKIDPEIKAPLSHH